jgi:hypothetical protein
VVLPALTQGAQDAVSTCSNKLCQGTNFLQNWFANPHALAVRKHILLLTSIVYMTHLHQDDRGTALTGWLQAAHSTGQQSTPQHSTLESSRALAHVSG